MDMAPMGIAITRTMSTGVTVGILSPVYSAAILQPTRPGTRAPVAAPAMAAVADTVATADTAVAVDMATADTVAAAVMATMLRWREKSMLEPKDGNRKSASVWLASGFVGQL